MRLRIPASQSKTRLGRLILEVLSEDLTSPLASNGISLIVGIEKITVVRIPMLVIGGNIIVVRVVGLQPVLLSLFGDQRDRTESETKKSRPHHDPNGILWTSGIPKALHLHIVSGGVLLCVIVRHTQLAPISMIYGLPSLSLPKGLCQARPPIVSRYSRIAKS
jgi:hypothetical protein